MSDKAFTILTMGYGYDLMDRVWDRVAKRTGYQISHVPHPSLFPAYRTETINDSTKDKRYHFLFGGPLAQLPNADLTQLAELEGDAGPTINNLIAGDERLRRLPYAEALRYVSVVTKRLTEILKKVEPDVVLSGYEGFHSTLFMLVCRMAGVPWYALTYTPIPRGMTGFSSTNNNKGTRSFGLLDEGVYRQLAHITLSKFESREVSAFVPKVESSLFNVISFLPLRLKNAFLSVRRHLTGGFDKYTHRPFKEAILDYLRRRKNLLVNRSLKLLNSPPEEPYVFFGFHMQPEMGIDVWAPYYSNQVHVIECIARSLPPTHTLLVKLHSIDADTWSKAELVRIQNMLGVQLVSAYADTLKFVSNADLVFSIQGTIALEAAMMGRQVISFGETLYEDMPSVTRVESLPDLPYLVRTKLEQGQPSRAEILSGLTDVMRRFRPGLYNNWALDPSESQLADFCGHLASLAHDRAKKNRAVD